MKKIIYFLFACSLTACSSIYSSNFGRLAYGKAPVEKKDNSTISNKKKELATVDFNTETGETKENNVAFDQANKESDFATLPTSKRPEIAQVPRNVKRSAPADSCDRFVLKNGDEKYIKVLEVNLDYIKYKNCSNLDGPDILIKKSEILFIQYTNGSRETFNLVTPKKEQAAPQSSYRKPTPTENMIQAGFILSIVSYPLSVLLPPIAILGLIFSWAGLVRGRRDSYLACNEKLAIAGIVLTSILFLSGIALMIIAATLY